jgi:hypothetical protein
MNLDEDEIYTKIVVFEEISSIFFHLKSSSSSKSRYTIQILIP